MLWYVKKDTILFDKIRFWEKTPLPYFISMIKIGFPSAVQESLYCGISMILTKFVTGWGDTAVAVQRVGGQIESLSWMTAEGFGMAINAFVGQNYGAKQYGRVRGIYRLAIACDLAVSLVGFLLFQLCPRQIISIFGNGDALYFEFAVKFMRTFLFMVLFNGVQLISSNFFSAIGKPLKGLILSMTRQVIFLIPLLIILPRVLGGIDGILYAAPVADAIAFLTTVLFISREMKRIRRLEAGQSAAG